MGLGSLRLIIIYNLACSFLTSDYYRNTYFLFTFEEKQLLDSIMLSEKCCILIVKAFLRRKYGDK